MSFPINSVMELSLKFFESTVCYLSSANVEKCEYMYSLTRLLTKLNKTTNPCIQKSSIKIKDNLIYVKPAF